MASFVCLAESRVGVIAVLGHGVWNDPHAGNTAEHAVVNRLDPTILDLDRWPQWLSVVATVHGGSSSS